MDNGIDASLGLNVVLTTLQRLRKQGILQGDVSHVAGFRGRCRCSITFVNGQIQSCMLEIGDGRSVPISIDAILAAENKKGPFSWSFHPQAPTTPQRQSLIPKSSTNPNLPTVHASPPYAQPDIRRIVNNTIPIPLKRSLDVQLLSSLQPNQRVLIGWLFSLIDGQRTTMEIATMLPRLRPEDIRTGLLFLFRIGAINLVNE